MNLFEEEQDIFLKSITINDKRSPWAVLSNIYGIKNKYINRKKFKRKSNRQLLFMRFYRERYIFINKKIDLNFFLLLNLK